MNSKEKIINQLDSVAYIDFHIHLEDQSPDDLQDSVLYLANSIDRESYNATLALAEKHRNVIALPGIHPARSETETWPLHLLEKIFSRSALTGEMGLDFFWIEDRSHDSRQREIFRSQLELSSKYKCVPSIHTKGAEQEVLDLLKEYGIQKSVVHWYSGPLELIPSYLDQGARFTIGPDIFKGSEVWKHIPPERIFAETDNPTGIPWILNKDARADDIVMIYRELALKLGEKEEKIINRLKKNMIDLLD
ncbi:TatD family hydrolase [Spirochaeta isovalerica]|uniref:TatD DNase family protein n=1 Tax=Spirochaeta isovalerica TaxID=150 RepID=A0A841RB15_9SPIO|nr:TatD family hydrolase [Spirochaeta isovalerica]MBB6480109.1 TatD DNase family protein [Spirochaeta isovalerica]